MSAFVGVAFGKFYDDRTDGELPPVPVSLQGDECPALLCADQWVGVLVAAFPHEAADVLRCARFSGDGVLIDPDAIAEHFDREASDAREAWEAYRAHSREVAGCDPGEGAFLLVSDTTAGLRR